MEIGWEIGTRWKGQRELGKKCPVWQKSSGSAGKAGAYPWVWWHVGRGRDAGDEDAPESWGEEEAVVWLFHLCHSLRVLLLSQREPMTAAWETHSAAAESKFSMSFNMLQQASALGIWGSVNYYPLSSLKGLEKGVRSFWLWSEKEAIDSDGSLVSARECCGPWKPWGGFCYSPVAAASITWLFYWLEKLEPKFPG